MFRSILGLSLKKKKIKDLNSTISVIYQIFRLIENCINLIHDEIQKAENTKTTLHKIVV